MFSLNKSVHIPGRRWSAILMLHDKCPQQWGPLQQRVRLSWQPTTKPASICIWKRTGNDISGQSSFCKNMLLVLKVCTFGFHPWLIHKNGRHVVLYMFCLCLILFQEPFFGVLLWNTEPAHSNLNECRTTVRCRREKKALQFS